MTHPELGFCYVFVLCIHVADAQTEMLPLRQYHCGVHSRNEIFQVGAHLVDGGAGLELRIVGGLRVLREELFVEFRWVLHVLFHDELFELEEQKTVQDNGEAV